MPLALGDRPRRDGLGLSLPASRLSRRLVADRVLFAAVIGASLVVLFAPTASGPELFPYADKVIHVLLFSVLAWSGTRAGVALVPLAAALVAYAVASETIQATVLSERAGDWRDVVADLVGLGIGLLVGSRRERIHSIGAESDRGRS